ncbi:MAG: hypothetical protein K5866_06440 [Treponema sp.]|nr:hypothetical protein [Treponema sp.]
MLVTLISTLLLMLAYFLILYAGVGFIQNKKFFGSAPKEILDLIPEKQERFPGAHVIGWILAVISFLIFAGAFVLGIFDAIKNDLSFIKIFLRFIIMLYGMEIFDIGLFDWVLLSHSNFFPHFYPQVKEVIGPHLFGFNWKTHLIHFLVYIPVSVLIAFLCRLF